MVDLSNYEPHDIATQPEDDVPQMHMGDELLPPVVLEFPEDANA